VLCLGGVKPGFEKGVLALRELRKSVENASARARLVAILDCCHVAGPSIGSRLHVTALPHQGKVADVVASAKAGDFDVCDRLLLGAEPGQSAYQMRLGTHRRGALTFSLVTAAERWRASGGRSHGSYKQVLKRAKKVVKALEVPQTVKLVAPAEGWKAIRKEPFLSVTAGPTTREPDVKGRSAQIDPNWLYKIYISDPVTKAQALLAQIVATPGGPSGAPATTLYVARPGCSPVNLGERYPGAECWYVNDAAVRQLASAVQLGITKEALPAGNTPESSLQLDPSVSGQPNNSLPLFKSPEQAWWNDTGYQYTSGKSYYFLGQESVSVGSGWSSLQRWLQLCVTTNANGSISLTGVQWWVNTMYGMPDGATFQPANASPYPSNSQGPQNCLGWRSL